MVYHLREKFLKKKKDASLLTMSAWKEEKRLGNRHTLGYYTKGTPGTGEGQSGETNPISRSRLNQASRTVRCEDLGTALRGAALQSYAVEVGKRQGSRGAHLAMVVTLLHRRGGVKRVEDVLVRGHRELTFQNLSHLELLLRGIP